MSASLRTELAKLSPPDSKTAVWIGPFEQLAGAGYALLAAEDHGIDGRRRRAYHDNVRRPLIPSLVRYLDSGAVDGIVRNWLAGFYFNSAKQRLVWAGERLLRSVGTLPCPLGDLPPQYTAPRANREKIVEAAKTTLAHMEAHEVHLPQTMRVADAHDEGGIFHLLNNRVNVRKHSVYPDPLHRQVVRQPERKELLLARNGFILLVASYQELLAWAPNATRPN